MKEVAFSTIVFLTTAGVLTNWVIMFIVGVLGWLGCNDLTAQILVYGFFLIKVFLYIFYLLLFYEGWRLLKLTSKLFVLFGLELLFMVVGDCLIYKLFWTKLMY